MNKPKKKASVKSVFNTKIAVLLDFLTLAQVPTSHKYIIKKRLWRIYDNLSLFEECCDPKATEVFRISIGILLEELETLGSAKEINHTVRKYIWNIYSDLALMETNIFWRERDLTVFNRNAIKGKKNE